MHRHFHYIHLHYQIDVNPFIYVNQYYITIPHTDTHITHKAKHIFTHSLTHLHTLTHWSAHTYTQTHVPNVDIRTLRGFAWSVAFVFVSFPLCHSLARPWARARARACVCMCKYMHIAQWCWVLLIHTFALCTSRHRYHHHRGHDTQSLWFIAAHKQHGWKSPCNELASKCGCGNGFMGNKCEKRKLI